FYENGTFLFKPAGIGTIVSADLFPVKGTYKINGNEIRFHGSGSATSATGTMSFAITGTIQKDSDGNQVAHLCAETRDGSNGHWYWDFRLPITMSGLRDSPVVNAKEADSTSKKSKSQKQIDESEAPIPSIKKILLLSANPKTSARLRLDENLREIEEGLLRSKRRDRFEIKVRLAVRHKDFRRALLNCEPHIVHF
ncbi:MAG: hypothetical protein GY950_10845, partial [bacterium]|nr:hypothetical protein [bacterium]